MVFERKNPSFALCGLNCCLCPRFNTEGSSRCPGCGGPGFTVVHPTCAVATCNTKHDSVEYCFQCSEYPCKKYQEESDRDSFISYKCVKRNFDEAKRDLARYESELALRYSILKLLLERYNDGKSKGLYCLVANDMPMDELPALIERIKEIPDGIDGKEKAKRVRQEIVALEKKLGIEFKLRK
ncbi:MAG: hypothetical protein CVV27_21330 [Candidatus Melainabacteria bacterium HGW-Melainabacteria-1]|nr:MAG: hypothetical protein CVV47_08840 [Spirochaetae bacterium HGW-Spirochaetae-3]PKL74278.1 MAG: hypothetical protein CVV27_21330 [Candidatus Melainabacteria bacterium HGW-Melainabacteria-1]